MTEPQPCGYRDHPEKIHGHYGFGGRHWCSDLGSPLLDRANLGVYENGQLVLYSNTPWTPPDSWALADALDNTAKRMGWRPVRRGTAPNEVEVYYRKGDQ